MNDLNTQKHCIHCNRLLPKEASFCPFCETQQVEVVEEKAPHGKRRLLLALFLAALAVAVTLLILYFDHIPKVYQGGSRITYPVSGGSVDVIASFDAGSGLDGHTVQERTVTLAEGNQGALPLWLCAYSGEDDSLVQTFAQEIDHCTVEASSLAARAESNEAESAGADGSGTENAGAGSSGTENAGTGGSGISSAMDIIGTDPVSDDSIPALWTTNVLYSTANGTNELRWTVYMKNGDQILLTQKLTCQPLQVVDLTSDDVPLKTVEDIQEAIASVSPDTVLNLYLPAVTYDEPLTLADRCVNLFGSVDAANPTVFTGLITINNRTPDMMTVSDIIFRGNGGTAIRAHEAVQITNCTFSGWKIGVDAEDGSWPVIESCVFEKNQTGIYFNSGSSTASSEGCCDTIFRKNEIAANLVRIPGDLDFAFPGCTFEENGEDVRKGSPE